MNCLETLLTATKNSYQLDTMPDETASQIKRMAYAQIRAPLDAPWRLRLITAMVFAVLASVTLERLPLSAPTPATLSASARQPGVLPRVQLPSVAKPIHVQFGKLRVPASIAPPSRPVTQQATDSSDPVDTTTFVPKEEQHANS